MKDSNSIVALSVSISARISPSIISSPTLFNQEATVPSVIVSLKRGIVTTVTLSGIATASTVELVSSTTVSVGVEISSVAAASPLNKAEKSSPSSPIIANNESTGAVSPSCKPICNNVPSLKDSNSMVALSVSISARISPSSILSPILINHFATTPSVIVSLKRGIVITIAILLLNYVLCVLICEFFIYTDLIKG